MANDTELFLLCRLDTRLCGLPLRYVAEIMRPLPVEILPHTPAFVLGVSVMRGCPTPVIDASAFLGGSASKAGRFVALKTGTRSAALAVDAVVGIRSIPRQSLQDLPPVLGLDETDAVTALGTLDNELLLVLSGIRDIPVSIWAQVESQGLE